MRRLVDQQRPTSRRRVVVLASHRIKGTNQRIGADTTIIDTTIIETTIIETKTIKLVNVTQKREIRVVLSLPQDETQTTYRKQVL